MSVCLKMCGRVGFKMIFRLNWVGRLWDSNYSPTPSTTDYLIHPQNPKIQPSHHNPSLLTPDFWGSNYHLRFTYEELSLKEVRSFAQGYTNSSRTSQDSKWELPDPGDRPSTPSNPSPKSSVHFTKAASHHSKILYTCSEIADLHLENSLGKGHTKWIIPQQMSEKSHIEKWAINSLTWCFFIFKASLKKAGTLMGFSTTNIDRIQSSLTARQESNH